MAKTEEEKAAAKAAKDVEKAAAKAAETASPTPAEKPETPAKPSKTEIVVKYRDHAGVETSRTFSKEVHGEDFAALAEEFKTTNATKLIA